jgi:hypothetical protein
MSWLGFWHGRPDRRGRGGVRRERRTQAGVTKASHRARGKDQSYVRVILFFWTYRAYKIIMFIKIHIYFFDSTSSIYKIQV